MEAFCGVWCGVVGVVELYVGRCVFEDCKGGQEGTLIRVEKELNDRGYTRNIIPNRLPRGGKALAIHARNKRVLLVI